jgi:hypothetical protein
VRKADNLPPSCAVVTKSGNLKFLEPSGPLRACNGTALPLSFYFLIYPRYLYRCVTSKSIVAHLTVAHNARLQRYNFALISSLRLSIDFILAHIAIDVLLLCFTPLISLTFIFFNNKAINHVSPLSSGAFCRHNRTYKCISHRHGGRDYIVVLLIASQQDEQSSNNGSIPRRHFYLFHNVLTGSRDHSDNYLLVPTALATGVEEPEREADRSTVSIAEVKNP